LDSEGLNDLIRDKDLIVEESIEDEY